ncbi:MAG: Asp-tRNA(Asn)/Glu-tRNA(Gln) amidotransferase subunit GatC [Patescibacteria group bacterium]
MEIDIAHLSRLARVAIRAEEMAKIKKDLSSILGYVSELEAVGAGPAEVLADSDLRNVMRSDTDAYEKGRFSESILSQAPDREGSYIAVKKILEK